MRKQALMEQRGIAVETSMDHTNSVGPLMHTVKHGESLSSISTHYYGTPSRWIDIFEANRSLLKTKNAELKEGMQLHIPQ